MGKRTRQDNLGLPPRIYFRSGTYYHVAKNIWTRLSIDKEEAIRMGAILDSDDGDDFPAFIKKGIHRHRAQAKAKGMDFNISADFIISLAAKQQWRCALTGIKFNLRKIEGKRRRPYAPSIDRIDSAQGYVESNVRVVCLATNLALNEWGDEIFLAQVRGAKRLSRTASTARLR